LRHTRFAVTDLLALFDNAFHTVLVIKSQYASRLLDTLGHPHAVELYFARCDQLEAGIAFAVVRLLGNP
jgi:hypothetical protein